MMDDTNGQDPAAQADDQQTAPAAAPVEESVEEEKVDSDAAAE